MALPNMFSTEVTGQIIERINKLQPNTTAQWGKMNVAQMLAHCNVTYEMLYEGKHPKPNSIMAFVLKLLVKNKVVNEEAYPRNSRTAPQFLIVDERIFDQEKERLVHYIQKTQALGAAHFEQKDSNSFGKLSAQEWNNMFYKHLNHHLNQFGV